MWTLKWFGSHVFIHVARIVVLLGKLHPTDGALERQLAHMFINV